MRRVPLSALLTAAALLALAGCGGGGGTGGGGGGGGTGGGSTALASPGGGVPIPLEPGGSAPSCPVDSYAPNYLADESGTRIHHWPRFPLTYAILNDWETPDGRSQAALVRQAAADWQARTGGVVRFVEVNLDDSPDVQIRFEDAIAGFDDAIGLAQYSVIRATAPQRDLAISRNPSTGRYVPVQVQIRRDADFLGRQPDFVRQTTFHELGHVLFLGGHSRTRTDAMFASLDPRLPVPNVADRDLNSLFAAYCGVFDWGGRSRAVPEGPVETRTIACTEHGCHPIP